MGSDAATGENPPIPEDTLDLGERLDPIRTLLRRAASGDLGAAAALVDVLGPRIHGLALHVTGSSAKAGRLAVWVLRSCLRDAGQLAAGGLPGEAAVLDRARRAAVATRPSGAVRSLIAPDTVDDRTRDRREVEVVRALLSLPPSQRALVESAAQGRFPYVGAQRPEAAQVLARVLDQLVPFGGPESPQLRSLAALDALALADGEERQHLRDLTGGTDAAAVHRHAIEAAARLALLTAVPPSRTLHEAVLDGLEFASSPQPAAREGGPSEQRRPAASLSEASPSEASPSPAGPVTAGTAGTAGTAPEAAYHGTYSTPVLGTDSQQRMVGPPAMAGGLHAATDAGAPATPSGASRVSRAQPAPAPAFAFRPTDEADRSRRERRRAAKQARGPGQRGASWFSRSLAALAVIAALAATWVVVDTRAELSSTREAASTWARLSVDPEAEMVAGVSDNGSWQAVIAADGIALRGQDVAAYDGEVLQLWGETDGERTDLGVLEVSAGGLVTHASAETADRLVVTRENAPQNLSGTPSTRVVASLDPELSGG